MFQKSRHEAGIFSHSSLTLASHKHSSGAERSPDRARRLSAARANRSMGGGMFSHGSWTSRRA